MEERGRREGGEREGEVRERFEYLLSEEGKE